MSLCVGTCQGAREGGMDVCKRLEKELYDTLCFLAIFIIHGAGCFIAAYSIPNTSIHFPRLLQAGSIFAGLTVLVVAGSILKATCNG